MNAPNTRDRLKRRRDLKVAGACAAFVAVMVAAAYAAVPLYEAEVDLKVRQGGAALGQLLDRAKVSELIDVNRLSIVASPAPS